jgi:hypothetical protein
VADYILDWSIDSVGPTINYGSTPLRYLLDYANVPPGGVATSSLTWLPEPNLNNTNRSFSLTLTLDAPGAVSFWVKVSSESTYDGLRFYIDDVQQAFYSGEGSFGLVSHSVAAGTHTFKWAYTKDGSAYVGQDNAWVALLKVTNVSAASMPPVQISTATPAVYDFEDGTIPSLITTTSWINSTNLPISGTRSLRTPVTTVDSATYTATIAIPELPENGCVSLDFKSSSESGDRTWFTLDGADYPFFQNQTVVKKMAFVIPQMAGTHTLRVEYRKDATLSQGDDATWIDNLHIPFQVGGTPPPPPPLTILLQDNFDRANSTTVVGAPQIGPSPVVQAGVGGISSNQLYPPTPALVVTYDLGTPNVEISFPATGIVSSSNSVVLGYVNSTDYWMVLFQNNTPVQLYRSTPGGFVSLYSGRTPYPTNATNCKGHYRDGIVRAYVDDILVGRWVLEKPITSTLHGVRISAGPGRLDNLLGTEAPVISEPVEDGAANADLLFDSTFFAPSSVYKGRDTKLQDQVAGA